ncbi:MAG: hypothetical protein EOO25_00465 [Comamonadaceae bacterium]|nr:MAG: hypothetical protein EOO25_00465 [Comamonadaceae bacterium]
MNNRTTASFLLAGMMAVAGIAHAQSGSASATTDVPTKAGEASTMTNGKPNAKTTNSTASDTSGTVRMGATGQTNAAATSSVPPKAGEASTSVNGRPNANPNDPMLTKSKAERKSEKEMKSAEAKTRREAAVMGQKGAQAGAKAGTPAVSPAGTPAVQDGGTPK